MTHPNKCDSTWEEQEQEQAFAKDAGGLFGELVWPPRSYSCSFCNREFKSAQALGGHMNVHRRDRARLKQQQQQQTNFDSNPRVLHLEDHINDNNIGAETSLSMGFNLESANKQIWPRVHARRKRRKTILRSFAPLFLEPSSSTELDLELRLGNSLGKLDRSSHDHEYI